MNFCSFCVTSRVPELQGFIKTLSLFEGGTLEFLHAWWKLEIFSPKFEFFTRPFVYLLFDIENVFWFPKSICYLILVFKFNITDPFLTLSKRRKNSTIAIFLLYFSLTNFLMHLIILLVFQRVSFGNSSFLFFFALGKL